MNKEVYYIAGVARIDGKNINCYLTVFNNWVTSFTNSDIEYFLSVDEAQARIAPMKWKMCFGAKTRMRTIYIKNSKGAIIEKVWENFKNGN
jgi:hypothetical protein